MELFVPRLWDRKVAGCSQPGDVWPCPTAAPQGAGHPACPALPGPGVPRIHHGGQADKLMSQFDVDGATLLCSLTSPKWVAG